MELTQEAYQKLFFDHWNQLVRLAKEKIGDNDEARDIVQNCFMKLWQHRERYTAERARHLIYGAVKNETIDWLRLQKKRSQNERGIRDIFYDDSEQAPDRLSAVLEAAKKLKPLEKAVFEAIFISGLSTPQAMEKLKLSQRYVLNLKACAISLLRHLILKVPDRAEETKKRLSEKNKKFITRHVFKNQRPAAGENSIYQSCIFCNIETILDTKTGVRRYKYPDGRFRLSPPKEHLCVDARKRTANQ